MMPVRLQQFLQKGRAIAIAAFGITGFIVLMRMTGLLQTVELSALDLFFRLRPPEAIDDRIVIIGISEADIQRMKRSIPSDAFLARLLKAIEAQKPKGIGLDIYRDIPEEPGYAELVEVFNSIPHLIGIRKVVGNRGDAPIASPAALAKTDRVGAADGILDLDGKLRRSFLYIYSQDDDRYIPHFGLRMALLYLQSEGIVPQNVETDPDAKQIGQATFWRLQSNMGGYIRTHAGSIQVLINYRRATFTTLSATEVMEGEIPPDLLRDRLVLIGYTAQSKKDLHLTPLSDRGFGLSEEMPGVEIQAHLTSQIISAALGERPLLHSWQEHWEWLWIFGWSLWGAILSWQGGYGRGWRRLQKRSLVGLGIAGIALGGICYVAFLQGWWLPFVPSFLGLFGTAIALGMAYLLSKVANLRAIFGRYMTDSVVATILETPEGLGFSGKRCEVTILMSDLRGFSAISEYLPPERVMELLDLYFEVMTETIACYDGTINEFIGDAILVFFGAPNPYPDHAKRGVACAVAMQLAMEEVNKRLSARGLPSIEMGIGLNTGEVVVGNVGSSKRAKWTAIGYHINLAARVESYTAGRQILVSWDTLAAAGDRVKVEQQRSVKPKGFKNPLNIYEVGGIEGKYDLFLPTVREERVILSEPIAIAFVIVRGKDVGEETFFGEIVELSTSSARVRADVSLEALNNLLLYLCDRREAGDLYAKVLEADSEGFSLRFTAVPPPLEELLFAWVKENREAL